MTIGALEKPVDPWMGNPDFHPVKCRTPGCNCKSFALYIPKSLDKDYEYWEKGEVRNGMFPKFFKGLSDSGEYHRWVRLTCAKCGVDLEKIDLNGTLEELQLFMSLGNWKPPKERSAQNKPD